MKKLCGLVCLSLWVLGGCNYCEFMATKIEFRAGEPARITNEFRNISSGEKDPAKIKSDFDDLILQATGDGYLAENAKNGIYVKNRELSVEDGQLVARVTAVSDMADEFFEFRRENGERFLFLDGYDNPEIVETDGKVIRTEKNILIVWPESAKEIYWKVRMTDLPEEFRQNQPKMVRLFQAQSADAS